MCVCCSLACVLYGKCICVFVSQSVMMSLPAPPPPLLPSSLFLWVQLQAFAYALKMFQLYAFCFYGVLQKFSIFCPKRNQLIFTRSLESASSSIDGNKLCMLYCVCAILGNRRKRSSASNKLLLWQQQQQHVQHSSASSRGCGSVIVASIELDFVFIAAEFLKRS